MIGSPPASCPADPVALERDVGQLSRLFAKEITVMYPGTCSSRSTAVAAGSVTR